jgi:uncharacterized protein (TIGR02145 family)
MQVVRLVGLSVLWLMFAVCSCSEIGNQSSNSYEVNLLDGQSWQSLNLAVTHFRNGDPIPEAQSDSAWQAAAQAGQPAWCYYQGSAAMGKKYGKLYNYYAITDPRGFAPDGWRIPSLSDWQAMNEVLDLQAALQLKAEKGWGEHCQTADVYGFAALPSGGRMATGDFLGEGTHATWWAHMEADEQQPSYVSMDCEVPWLEHFTDEKGSGFAVRLLREESAEVRSANPN